MAKWEEIIRNHVKPAVEELVNKLNAPISIRGIHYNLVSKGVYANTGSNYKQLSKHLVDARKSGLVHWNDILDETRESIAEFTDFYISPEDLIDRRLDELSDELPDDYRDRYLYRGYKQKNYVEVWIEKQALVPAFRSFLEDRDIRLVPMRGFSSWSYAYENFKRLKHQQDPRNNAGIEKKIYILYFGDLDSYGLKMDKFIKRLANYFVPHFGIKNLNLIPRIALNPQHIKRYDLPKSIDDKGNNTAELDALLAYVPNEFRKMVQNSVDKYFNDKIYRSVRKQRRHQPRYIRSSIGIKVREWLESNY